MSGQPKLNEKEENRDPVLCAMCGHPNAESHSTCGACGAHLHLKCRRCGRRNARTETHCTECGRRLHRSPLTRLKRFLFRGRRKLIILQTVLLLIGVFVAWKLIIFFAEFRLPEAGE